MSVNEKATRVCPQCDGAGQEELGRTPILCRKCAGRGSLGVIQRAASIMSGGAKLEKTAQGNLDDPTEDDEDMDFFGSGIDELSASSGSMSDEDLKFGIMQFMKSMSTAQTLQLFDRMLLILGAGHENARSGFTKIDRDGKEELDEGAIYNSITDEVGKMTNSQLRSMFCEARRFV